MKKVDFETSKDLKALFNEHYDRWRRKHPGGIEELARRCGVSPAYLAHVGRYGRIPGKPVLILLAFNFELDSHQRILDAAGIKEDWPYESDMGLNKTERSGSGLLSIKLDMDGFTEAIRAVVRSENRQRSVKDLIGKRPLRMGLNLTQRWMFEERLAEDGTVNKGFFPEFAEMLGVALQRDIETVPVPFREYVDQLTRGDIDLYGPMLVAPNPANEILFTAPLYKIGVSVVMRKRETDDLPVLPPPEKIEDLKKDYVIAVLKNALPHLLANTRLKRPDSSLILCESDEEALDRILMRGIKRPAHVFICNALLAKRLMKNHQKDLSLLFATKGSMLDMADDAIAVRPDWPEILPPMNEAIRFLLSRGGLANRLMKSLTPEVRDLIEA